MINFIKMHGLGNDFIMIDLFKEKMIDYTKYVQEWCHRHKGIGADGLVLLEAGDQLENEFKMTIYNSDGSEAEMCGNAIRCFAKYVYEEGMIDKNKFRVETKAGVMKPELNIVDGIVKDVTVNMGKPRLKPEEIPVESRGKEVVNQQVRIGDGEYQITTVSMGNPHCIIYVDDVDKYPIERVGPMIETDGLFPQGVNVEFIEIIDKSRIKMRVWERGAGLTLACGTGACAAVVASIKNKLTSNTVTVQLPGGELSINWAEDGCVYMTGPAEYSFRGVINPNHF